MKVKAIVGTSPSVFVRFFFFRFGQFSAFFKFHFINFPLRSDLDFNRNRCRTGIVLTNSFVFSSTKR